MPLPVAGQEKKRVAINYYTCRDGYLYKDVLHVGDLTFVLKHDQNYIENSMLVT